MTLLWIVEVEGGRIFPNIGTRKPRTGAGLRPSLTQAQAGPDMSRIAWRKGPMQEAGFKGWLGNPEGKISVSSTLAQPHL
jgi:hypothetical protein